MHPEVKDILTVVCLNERTHLFQEDNNDSKHLLVFINLLKFVYFWELFSREQCDL